LQVVIEGFKSYKDQTVLEPFSNRINCVGEASALQAAREVAAAVANPHLRGGGGWPVAEGAVSLGNARHCWDAPIAPSMCHYYLRSA
jgi:hypothetical protein